MMLEYVDVKVSCPSCLFVPSAGDLPRESMYHCPTLRSVCTCTLYITIPGGAQALLVLSLATPLCDKVIPPIAHVCVFSYSSQARVAVLNALLRKIGRHSLSQIQIMQLGE